MYLENSVKLAAEVMGNNKMFLEKTEVPGSWGRADGASPRLGTREEKGVGNSDLLDPGESERFLGGIPEI